MRLAIQITTHLLQQFVVQKAMEWSIPRAEGKGMWQQKSSIKLGIQKKKIGCPEKLTLSKVRYKNVFPGKLMVKESDASRFFLVRITQGNPSS